MNDLEEQKERAAIRAVDHIKSGMTVGLGSGSTATYAVHELSRRLQSGELEHVSGVPTSEATTMLARELGIPLAELSGSGIDLAFDGMDEVTENLAAIKGLGGALTREKIVASQARTFVLVGDESKFVAGLGERSPVPVEVIRFGWRATLARLSELGCEVIPRSRGEDLLRTDNGHYVLDCHFGRLLHPHALAEAMRRIPGVIEHGLFLDMADIAYIADSQGVRALTVKGNTPAT